MGRSRRRMKTSSGCVAPWSRPHKGRGSVEPNPLVGAVVVRDGQFVGAGHHERFGGAHAEVVALNKAGDAARGATLYVTLEPCCHFGKTPPCTDAILAAGIARVVVAIVDPFPEVNGRGVAALEAAGIAGGDRLRSRRGPVAKRGVPEACAHRHAARDRQVGHDPGRQDGGLGG